MGATFFETNRTLGWKARKKKEVDGRTDIIVMTASPKARIVSTKQHEIDHSFISERFPSNPDLFFFLLQPVRRPTVLLSVSAAGPSHLSARSGRLISSLEGVVKAIPQYKGLWVSE
ncbi:hypothetical protein AVEN_217634-1 [Araneus ventricosus]|uniref:Uncharacterized protein n=1 Tax=Araneus ventricosus TaxID=182803 RepID=A0A4Y2SQX8_ARAVE|nr:hypothetical protein AVEN_217634-1 [Araneus ventricosus]